MKKYFWCLSLLMPVLFFCSCKQNVLKGEGQKGSVSPEVASFTAIEVELSLKAVIKVQEGAHAGVHMNGYENLLKHIKTRVENNTMHIYSDLDETWRMESDEVEVEITMPSLTLLKLTGAPDADVHGSIAGADFRLDLSGASTVVIDDIHTDNFSMEASGAAEVVVKGGVVKTASYEINGAGNVKAFGLQTMETTTEISGAGGAEVTAQQKLDVSISGAGSIKYKGHPAITKDISGAGGVTDAN